MPIVKSYECEECGWELDKWHAEGREHTPPICPSCMKLTKQIITAPSIVLKGIGWARDGYSRDIDQAELEWYRRGDNVSADVKKIARKHGIRQEKNSPEEKQIIKNLKTLQKAI